MYKFTEKLLLFKAKNKDPEAFGRIYDQYSEKIYRFIFFKVSNIQEAEDITSEVFLKAWQYLVDKGKNKTIENLNAFLYTVARNSIIDFYRKKSKEAANEAELNHDAIGQVADKGQDIEEKAAIGSEMQIIQDAIKELKEEYRELITLRYLNELSIKEIAKILDKSRGAVRVSLFRATKTLKSFLEGQGKETEILNNETEAETNE